MVSMAAVEVLHDMVVVPRVWGKSVHGPHHVPESPTESML